jgi:hypothetical protein
MKMWQGFIVTFAVVVVALVVYNKWIAGKV